jgi:hypothetical protein
LAENLHYFSPTPHEAFKTPSPDAVVWRYMSLAKLLSLVESSRLFFCYADRLGDPYEGTLPLAMHRDAKRDMTPEAWDQMLQGYRQLRRVTAVNCWHMGDHESAAMWQLYAPTGEGIAVRSTVGRLAASLPQTPTPHLQSHANIFIGRVHYVDYEKERIPRGNAYWPFVHKRRSFEHERELRVLTIAHPPEPQPTEGDRDDVDVAGVAVPIDVAGLVDEVLVAPSAPRWFENLVRGVLARLGLDAIVARSRLGKDPLY